MNPWRKAKLTIIFLTLLYLFIILSSLWQQGWRWVEQ